MDLSAYVDHTLLKVNCSKEDIEQLCNEAIQHRFTAVCIPPYFVPLAFRILRETPVKIATVVGFPMGYASISAKVEEIKHVLNEKADEVDAVINISAVKNGEWNVVNNELDSMTTAVHMRGKLIKVILETSLLTDEEIIKLCEICNEKEVDFVKTSTGINGKATIKAVKLMTQHLNGPKIKASGGIRTKEDAEKYIALGVKRIGTSSGIQIVS